ncbi:Bug family tripartite tricarboxylate transporter substrate binding protein [Reyranella sp.]|uniref:Bug family tripartite tricarboxylate transporter substrate binding protein n=1 Tax=Reyranella sp. TaxID=1929291 RepID=UPI003D0F30DF
MAVVRAFSRRTLVVAAAALSTVGGTSAQAQAQSWPTRTIQLIVPFPPGGGSDTFARPFAAKLATQLGQQVVIDNRAGAAGTIGAAMVARAAPDGYTLLFGAVHHTVAANVYRALPYDIERDLMPITGIAYVPDVLVMSPSLPVADLRAFIAYCRANPDKVNYGSSGIGTSRHLAGEIFNAMTGAAMVHVPYKGSGPANAALMAGEISVIFEGLGSAAPYLQSGRFRPLALAAARRSPTFPDIPTMAEAGLPDFESLSWYGLWAPAGTPREIVGRIQAEVARVFEAPEMKEAWLRQGAETGGESSGQFARYVHDEVVKWGKVVRANNIVLD